MPAPDMKRVHRWVNRRHGNRLFRIIMCHMCLVTIRCWLWAGSRVKRWSEYWGWMWMWPRTPFTTVKFSWLIASFSRARVNLHSAAKQISEPSNASNMAYSKCHCSPCILSFQLPFFFNNRSYEIKIWKWIKWTYDDYDQNTKLGELTLWLSSRERKWVCEDCERGISFKPFVLGLATKPSIRNPAFKVITERHREGFMSREAPFTLVSWKKQQQGAKWFIPFIQWIFILSPWPMWEK